MKKNYLKLCLASLPVVILLAGLYMVNFYDHILFRALSGILSITTASLIFFVVSISKKHIKNSFWSIIGTIHLFIGCLYILYTLYFIEGEGPNLFSTGSGCAILFILLSTLIFIIKSRQMFEEKTFKYLLFSNILSALSAILLIPYAGTYYLLRLLEPSFIIFSLCLMLMAVVDTVIVKPYDEALKELRIKDMQLKEASFVDEQTGVFNKRAALNTLERMIKLLKRNKQDLSICYIGLDNLYEVIDSYGQEEGEVMVNTLISALKESIRQSDYICRFEDDEFLLILPGCGVEKINIIIERIREYLANLGIRSKPYSIDFSYGLACYNCSNTFDIDSFLRIADFNLYENKVTKKEAAATNLYD